MKFGSWNFRPALLPSLATLIIFPLLLSLGFWQLDRAAEKEQIMEKFETHYNGSPVDMNTSSFDQNDLAAMQWQKVTVTGHFESEHQFLLDNQPMNFKTGYLVFTPFKLSNKSTRVLVNRGWVPANMNRKILPDVSLSGGTLTLLGTTKSPPFSGITLSDNLSENLENGLVRIQKLELEQIESITGHTFLPYIVRLDKKSPQGYLREWVLPGSGAAKHYGYAFQWFAMAAAVIIIFLVVNFKKETK